jgi:hypothetical protein
MKTLFDVSYYTIYCLREDGTRPAGMSRVGPRARSREDLATLASKDRLVGIDVAGVYGLRAD